MSENKDTIKEKRNTNKFILAIRWFISLFILLVIVSYGVRTISKAFYTRHIAIEVTDKAVKNNKYMVYGKTVDPEHSPESYEITDSALAKRFNSSDLYGEIEIGKTYVFIVGGNRVPFMSWYPDIFSATEIQVLDGETEEEYESVK